MENASANEMAKTLKDSGFKVSKSGLIVVYQQKICLQPLQLRFFRTSNEFIR